MGGKVGKVDPSPRRSFDGNLPLQHVDRCGDAHIRDRVANDRDGFRPVKRFVEDAGREGLRPRQLPEARQNAVLGAAVEQNPGS